MKLTYQSKVGILAVIVLIFLVRGYYYLRDKNTFSNDIILYAEYDEAGGLAPTNPVLMSGYRVGKVGKVSFNDDQTKIVVQLDIDPTLRLKKNTKANIVTLGALGDMGVRLMIDGPCEDGNCLKTGDKIEGENITIAEEALKVLDPYLQQIEEGLLSADSMFTAASSSENSLSKKWERTNRDFQSLMTNLDNASKRLTAIKKVTSEASTTISQNLTQGTTKTTTPDNESMDVDKIMQSLNDLAKQLNTLDLKKTTADTDKSIASIGTQLKEIQKSITSVNNSIDGLSNGDGTISKLLNDGTIIDTLNATVRRIDSLLIDYRMIPKKKKKKK